MGREDESIFVGAPIGYSNWVGYYSSAIRILSVTNALVFDLSVALEGRTTVYIYSKSYVI